MMNGIEVVHWCALCNSRRADGTLTIEDLTLDGEHVPLPACQTCVDGLDFPQQLSLEF